jgi:hypothetical protein
MADQVDEDVEDLGLDGHGAAVAPKLAASDVDLAVPEREAHRSSLARWTSALDDRQEWSTMPKQPAKKSNEPVLLSGGNPQIPKGEGDGPVQAYLAAMPGWKRDVGVRLDALIERTVPGVHKAVKWNSPFYGVEEDGWFLNFHCFTKYVKVAFFRGASLHPVPPGVSKSQDTRYLDIHEDDELDEAQLADWIEQASKLPGERL